MQTDLSDYNGNLPGDEWYNVIGARIKYIGTETGLTNLEHLPNQGIVSMKSLNDEEVAKFHKARRKFNTELDAVIADIVQA